MPSPWLLPEASFVALLALSGLAYLLAAGIRTWNLKECLHCGAEKVRPSMSNSWLDVAVRLLFLRPYRCGGCLNRFYGFRTAYFKPRLRIVPAPIQARPFPIRVKVIIRLPAFTTRQSFREWLTELQDAAELDSVT